MGGNVGDREGFLKDARRALEKDPDLEVLDASQVYETAPVGPPQDDYLNAALLVRTSLSPEQLLERCLGIEKRMGRARRERWGPRTLDLDLLWADEGDGTPISASTDALTLPHPHLAERSFALAPLLDVRPDLGSRFAQTLGSLGGAPAPTPVKGWTSFLRRK